MFQIFYPPESDIVEVEGCSTEDHETSTVRLKCTTKEEFLNWFAHHHHLSLSGVTFRVLKTRPAVGKRVFYCVSLAKEPIILG